MPKTKSIQKLRLTKGLITRGEAIKLSPDYVRYSETGEPFEKMFESFNTLKRGDKVVTVESFLSKPLKFVLAKVSSVDRNSYQAEDGPVIRVTNGEFSWRVDGSGYAGKAVQ